MRFHILCTAWIFLSILFLIATIHQNRHAGHNEQQGRVFPSSLVACCSIAFAVEAIVSWRDYERVRYGSFQRLLQLLAMLVLWSMYATRALVQFDIGGGDDQDAYVNGNDGNDVIYLSTWDFIVLIAATMAVILVLLDAWLAHKRPTPARRLSLQKAAANNKSKASLPWETWGYLLKPYFWPDATNTTALWNRACAIATWFCVFSSKACGLVAPLMLGKAATALAHQEYRDCIKFSILHALFTFMASTFKECQSLVYLSVAQAAFVQLSEAVFHHLHHLSLDWHLGKKLGEVR